MDIPIIVTIGTEILTTADFSVLLIMSLINSFQLTVNTLGHVIRVFQKVFNDDQIVSGYDAYRLAIN